MIYIASKRKLYLRASFFWLALIGNFLVQSAAQGGETAIILGYSFTVIPLNLLCFASVYFSNDRYPWKTFIGLAVTGFAGSLALLQFPNVSFVIKAMPLAIATAAPLLYTAYLFLISKRHSTSSIMKFHAIVLTAIAIHCFNFAFFRMDPSAQLWGWPVSYALYQLLAAIIPAMSLDFYHKQEKERLNETIAERTMELNKSNVHLKRALKDKEFIFKTLVHDVSNPLSVLQGRVKIFHKKQDTEKFVSAVENMTNRISSLVNQVKMLETTQSDNSAIQIDEVSLEKNILSLIPLFEEKLNKKRISFKYDVEEFKGITVFAEQNSLSNSIIPNILNNAIKFTHADGEIEIRVSMPSDDKCMISVKDQGIGIPEETLKNIFDFDADTSRPGTEGEAGTGFGLPILKKLIEKNNGEIFIDTKVQTDTTPGFTSVNIVLDAKRALKETQLPTAA